jgi:hypothetical protein
MIAFSVLSMYKVFVDRQPVAPVVQMKDVQIATQYGPLQLPMQAVNTLANIGLFAVFMLFILGAGGKVAGIGVNLLKTERLREALLLSQQKPDEETLKKL